MRELLSHKYEVRNPKEIEVLARTCKGKDIFGNNIFHEVFQMEADVRNEYLELIFDPQYHVKIYMAPQYSCCLCCRKLIKNTVQDEDAPPLREVQIGEFTKRNRLSFLPTDYEFEDPVITTPPLKERREIQKLLVESLEADYVIVTSEDRPGDQKCKLIENQL
jgi:hypothetical protein